MQFASDCSIRPIWGPRPPSEWGPVEKSIGQGFANRPYGNAGVQYGFQALQSGQITPAEFADLNAKIGGLDIDHKPTAARSPVDESVAEIAYRTSQVTDPRQLRTVPIIDLRVKAGDTVSKGQPLLVLEAMKMEHTLTAPADGTVKTVRYAVGEQVPEGAELVEFEGG